MPRCDVPWVREEDNDVIAVDAGASQLRFLVQELIFTHRQYQPQLRLSLEIFCAESAGSP